MTARSHPDEAGRREHRKASVAAYRLANLDAIKAREKAYYAANRERICAQVTVYQAKNAEKLKPQRKIRAAAWAAANPEKRKASKAAYRARHPEVEKAYAARYRAENADKVKAANARWREVYPERQQASKANWTAAHPEKIREYNARTRVLRAAVELCNHPACLALGPVQLAWQTNPHKCYLCGVSVSMGRGGNLHIDHVIPLSRGGIHCAENLRPACAPCNRRKYDKPLQEVQTWT